MEYNLMKEVIVMETAKVISNDHRQAVRLPKSCRMEAEEVLVTKVGGMVVLIPKEDPWSGLLEALSLFSDDFLCDDIADLPQQERDGL